MAEDAASFMRQRIAAVSQLLSSLRNAEEDLANSQRLTDAEAKCLLQLTGEQAINTLNRQIAAWQLAIAKDAKLPAATPPSVSTPAMSEDERKTKALNKLAQMGGTPVMGGFHIGPNELREYRKALHATSSNAAQEMASQSEGMPQNSGQPQRPASSPSWLDSARSNLRMSAIEGAS